MSLPAPGPMGQHRNMREAGSRAGGGTAPGCPPAERIAEWVRAATMAPSMHNTQPWKFRILRDNQTIEVRADPERMLRHGDPHGRAVHIACGAALFNLRIAVAAGGREPVTRLLPDPAEPLLLATVRLGGRHRTSEDERDLYAAIPARHTNRRPFSARPVPPGVLAELVQAAQLEGAVLDLPGDDETRRLLGVVADAETDLLADPGYRAELARWAGGERDQDGVPASAAGPRDPRGRTPVRDFLGGAAPGYEWFEDPPRLAVLSTPGNGNEDWLRAGEALQGVLLTATLRGIAAGILTQPLETPDAWLVRDPAGAGWPQLILRLGYGLPVPATPRRPVRDVLIEEPPPGKYPE
jgi:nitroreductase